MVAGYALDSRPAVAVVWCVALLLAIAGVVRWGSRGIRPDVRISRVLAWSCGAVVLGVIATIALPTPIGVLVATLLVALPLYLWSLALEPAGGARRPARR